MFVDTSPCMCSISYCNGMVYGGVEVSKLLLLLIFFFATSTWLVLCELVSHMK